MWDKNNEGEIPYLFLTHRRTEYAMLLFKNGQPFAVITNDRDAEVMGAEVYVTKEGESLRFDALGGDYRVKVITKKVAFDECLLDVTAEGFEVPKQYRQPEEFCWPGEEAVSGDEGWARLAEVALQDARDQRDLVFTNVGLNPEMHLQYSAWWTKRIGGLRFDNPREAALNRFAAIREEVKRLDAEVAKFRSRVYHFRVGKQKAREDKAEALKALWQPMAVLDAMCTAFGNADWEANTSGKPNPLQEPALAQEAWECALDDAVHNGTAFPKHPYADHVDPKAVTDKEEN